MHLSEVTQHLCGGDADDAEGSLVQLVHQQWVAGSTAARSDFARAGMEVLTQLWASQGGSSSMMRLHAHLDATILEEVSPCHLFICTTFQVDACARASTCGLSVTMRLGHAV